MHQIKIVVRLPQGNSEGDVMSPDTHFQSPVDILVLFPNVFSFIDHKVYLLFHMNIRVSITQ